jgi:NTP pyrophosphatase (non-canonical NTP hydrolase)
VTLNEYQEEAMITDVFDKSQNLLLSAPGFVEKVLGLVGESGEFADKIKKIIRDSNGECSDAKKEELIKELGDVLWYIASIANYLDVDLDQVGAKNIAKLRDRQARNVIQSEGDNR